MSAEGWRIAVPFRERSDSLIDAAAACRELPAEHRAVSREVVCWGLERGLRTVDDLLGELDRAGHRERRALLDGARERSGLETATDLDAKRALAEALRWPPRYRPKSGAHRDGDGAAFQTCAEPGCHSYSHDSEGRPAGRQGSPLGLPHRLNGSSGRSKRRRRKRWREPSPLTIRWSCPRCGGEHSADRCSRPGG